MIHRRDYWSDAQDAAAYLGKQGMHPADVVIQCGSGLAALGSKLLPQHRSIQLDELPRLPTVTVTGHGKEAVYGAVGKLKVLVLTGRIHVYEGHDPATAGFPAAIAKAAGAQLFICTSAAGALDEHLQAGEVMLHSGFINFQGDNALRHLQFDDAREGLLSMNPPYHAGITAVLLQRLKAAGLEVHQGTYISTAGPVFETLPELKMMRAWGADAIGMSTVPEVTICHLLQLPVVGLSVLTNECFRPGGVNHDEVVAAGRRVVPPLAQGLRAFLEDSSWLSQAVWPM